MKKWQVRDIKLKNILIVCTGNICRSPMAEVLFAAQVKGVSVSSAGVAAVVGASADPMTQELMRELGLDLSAHRARQATREILSSADLILTMETRQQKQIEYNLPSLCGKIHRLGKWSGFDIIDPYKRPKVTFAQTLLLIKQGIDDWQRQLWS